MLAFLKEHDTHPDKDHPDVKLVVAEVQGYLDEAVRKAAASTKEPAA